MLKGKLLCLPTHELEILGHQTNLKIPPTLKNEIVFSFSPVYLLTSVPIVKLLLLCDWGTYRAAVCCGMGSVMTAGLMLGGWCGEHSGWVNSCRPQSLAQGFVVERSDLQPAPVSPCVSYKRRLHVATVLLAPINLRVHRILFLT